MSSSAPTIHVVAKLFKFFFKYLDKLFSIKKLPWNYSDFIILFTRFFKLFVKKNFKQFQQTEAASDNIGMGLWPPPWRFRRIVSNDKSHYIYKDSCRRIETWQYIIQSGYSSKVNDYICRKLFFCFLSTVTLMDTKRPTNWLKKRWTRNLSHSQQFHCIDNNINKPQDGRPIRGEFSWNFFINKWQTCWEKKSFLKCRGWNLWWRD